MIGLIDIGLVESSIEELENSNMSYEQCRNLAALYSVRDNYYKKQKADEGLSGSEFMRTVAGLPVQQVFGILDELMDAVRIMNYSTYRATIQELQKL